MGLIVSVDRGTAKPDKRSAIALVADDENPSRYITSVGSDGSRDRIALRDYLRKLSWMYRRGEIDERTTQQGLNKVVMAAAANSPEVLNYIRA